MANTKDNRRVKYTKSTLKRSLLTLLRTRPLQRITVKELCEEADLNRGTFYAYYKGPEDLLRHIEEEFYVDIMASVTTFRVPDDVVSIFTQALTLLKERRELSEVLFGRNGDTAFLKRIIGIARDTCVYQWGTLAPEVSQEERGRMYDFVSYGCMHTIQNWLAGGMKESPEELSVFLNEICNNAVLPLLGQRPAPEKPGAEK